MAVPPFQEFMLPFLEFISDGKEHHISELFDFLAQRFGLSEQDQKELLPAGQALGISGRESRGPELHRQSGRPWGTKGRVDYDIQVHQGSHGVRQALAAEKARPDRWREARRTDDGLRGRCEPGRNLHRPED